MSVRFRCDSCGKHVPLRHDTCPHCGRRFTAVVCPVCRFEGDPSQFASGCPKCGYQGKVPQADAGKKEKKPRSALPSWFYLLSSILLLLLLAGLVVMLLAR